MKNIKTYHVIALIFLMLAFVFGNDAYTKYKDHTGNTEHTCSGNDGPLYEYNDDGYLHIEEGLMKYVEEFKKDCSIYGIDPDIVNELNAITLEDLEGMNGYTWYDYAQIEINIELQSDTIGMRHVVYHELGHWYGLYRGNEHGDYGIMFATYDPGDSFNSKAEWNEYLNHFFDELSQL